MIILLFTVFQKQFFPSELMKYLGQNGSSLPTHHIPQFFIPFLLTICTGIPTVSRCPWCFLTRKQYIVHISSFRPSSYYSIDEGKVDLMNQLPARARAPTSVYDLGNLSAFRSSYSHPESRSQVIHHSWGLIQTSCDQILGFANRLHIP